MPTTDFMVQVFNGSNVTVDPSQGYDEYRSSHAFAARSLGVDGVVAFSVLGIAMLVDGSVALYKLIRSSEHTVRGVGLRCNHIHANAKEGNFYDHCVGWHGAALSNVLVIIVSSSNYLSCLASHAAHAYPVVGKMMSLLPETHPHSHARTGPLFRSLLHFDNTLLYTASVGGRQCSASGQGSNLLSAFVTMILFFRGNIFGRKFASVASILDFKAHALIMCVAMGIGSSSSFATIVFSIDTMNIGSGSAWAKDIVSFCSSM